MARSLGCRRCPDTQKIDWGVWHPQTNSTPLHVNTHQRSILHSKCTEIVWRPGGGSTRPHGRAPSAPQIPRWLDGGARRIGKEGREEGEWRERKREGRRTDEGRVRREGGLEERGYGGIREGRREDGREDGQPPPQFFRRDCAPGTSRTHHSIHIN